ncbi:MAG: efflux RND transporter periplasmic adaptor subunit [Clostridiales Family XIII bacterium]|jgi:RND family efflux transporter MFP subunit|nr:efflux RND transporter periplasmic adaptor subunit [Clostridiales Family XIII bacterium]
MHKENTNGPEPAENAAATQEHTAKENAKSRRRVGRALKWILSVFIIALLAIAGFRIVTDRLTPQEVAEEAAINVRVANAVIADINSNLILTGRLEATEEAVVIPKLPGEVTRVYAELGKRVNKGDRLFEIDRDQLATSVNQAKIAYDDAVTNLERIRTLYEEGAVALQMYEQAQSAFNMARESYAAAGDAIANAVVTAPIGGHITSVNVSVGGMASQTSPAVTISNIDKLEINTGLSENMINKVKIGDTVDVRVKSVSEDESFSGTVTALAPAPATGSLTYPVVITLENPGEAVKPGMFAEVTITADRAEGVLAVPSAAVFPRAGRRIVISLDAENRVVLNDVVAGVDNGELTEIKSGLAAGDRVVTEGQFYLNTASKVNIVE